MKTEQLKMLAGELYDPMDPELDDRFHETCIMEPMG
jgi:hypothetical protein